MAYKRMTAEEREHIYRWRREGRKQSEIARRLDRDPGSIRREIARNTGRRGSKKAGRLRSSAAERGWRDDRACARKRSTSTSTPTPKRAGRCGRTFPAPSANGNGAAPVKMAASAGRRKMCALFKTLPPKARRSATLDNGKEFAQHEDLGRDAGIDVFFAHPSHSWERGTNENTNGLIRRLHPKKSSFADIGGREFKRIDTFLNDRPRKILGWSTPREKMAVFLGCTP